MELGVIFIQAARERCQLLRALLVRVLHNLPAGLLRSEEAAAQWSQQPRLGWCYQTWGDNISVNNCVIRLYQPLS